MIDERFELVTEGLATIDGFNSGILDAAGAQAATVAQIISTLESALATPLATAGR